MRSPGNDDEAPTDTDATSSGTRRRVLRSLGGIGVVGILAGSGWLRRTQYLDGDRDRTRSVFTGRFLGDETLSEMRSFVDAPDEDVPAQRGYGLGIRHLQIDGEDLYGHTGTIPGYSAIAMYHENPQYTIAVLSNVSTIDQTGIYGTLQDVVEKRRKRGGVSYRFVSVYGYS